jgi:D-galactarolactone cycloisomerase
MELASVEAVPLRRELDERFANAQKWIDAREYCLVRAETHDGSVGWGECWGPVAGNREIVEEYAAPRLVGEDPREVERLHDELTVDLRSSYHSHVPAGVVSGVDLALWDLYGKAVDLPVATLLGGRRRERVRAYATGHFFRDVDSLAAQREAVREEARGHVDAGFDALKVKIGFGRHFPYGTEADVERVRTVREVAPDARLMVDANHAYTVAEAERVGRRLAHPDLAVHFFEEPVGPDPKAYDRLSSRIEVPLAAGECVAGEEGFDPYLDRDALSYVQPDVTSAGGITSTRRVADAASAANVQCLPHVFGSAVALAASLQVLATLSGDPMLEFDRTPNPIREDLAVDPIENEGNEVPVPDGPGLGVEIDPDTLERFRTDR